MKEWIEKLKREQTEMVKKLAREQSFTEYPVTLRLTAEIEVAETIIDEQRSKIERLEKEHEHDKQCWNETMTNVCKNAENLESIVAKAGTVDIEEIIRWLRELSNLLFFFTGYSKPSLIEKLRELQQAIDKYEKEKNNAKH